MKNEILFLATSLAAMPVLAHHNAAAHYRIGESMTIEGVVTEFRAVNPHARIYFETTNAQGETETWMAEGDSFINLRRAGWTVDQLKPGDRIEIVGHPSRNGSNLVEWTSIALAQGTELGGGNGQIEERLRYLEERLAQYRASRAQSTASED
jgi:hypothetical protein